MSTIPTENRVPPAPPRVVAISGMIFAAMYIAGLVFTRPQDNAHSSLARRAPKCRGNGGDSLRSRKRPLHAGGNPQTVQ